MKGVYTLSNDDTIIFIKSNEFLVVVEGDGVQAFGFFVSAFQGIFWGLSFLIFLNPHTPWRSNICILKEDIISN